MIRPDEERAENGRGLGGVLLAGLAVAPMTYVIVMANYWIYWARAEYIALYPERAALEPPTISKALRIPHIGEPFGFWMVICAAVLMIAALPVAWLYWRASRDLPLHLSGLKRVLLGGVSAALVAHLVATTGMAILSAYRGPDFGDMHMVGSYMFFVSETLAMLILAGVNWYIARDPQACAALEAGGWLSPRAAWLRARLAFASVLLAGLFMGLFLWKDLGIAFLYDQLYLVYVLSEPAMISFFLVVFATYYPELIRAFAGRRFARPLAAASQTRD